MYILSRIWRRGLVCKAFLGKDMDFDLERQRYNLKVPLLRALYTPHSLGDKSTRISTSHMKLCEQLICFGQQNLPKGLTFAGFSHEDGLGLRLASCTCSSTIN